MHRTVSLDYGIVFKGSVIMHLDDGSTTRINEGEVIVQRGTMHAWESFGDGASPDMQAVAKGLGGGYATIGAVLMGPRVARGFRDGAGFMKHGHT